MKIVVFVFKRGFGEDNFSKSWIRDCFDVAYIPSISDIEEGVSIIIAMTSDDKIEKLKELLTFYNEYDKYGTLVIL